MNDELRKQASPAVRFVAWINNNHSKVEVWVAIVVGVSSILFGVFSHRAAKENFAFSVEVYQETLNEKAAASRQARFDELTASLAQLEKGERRYSAMKYELKIPQITEVLVDGAYLNIKSIEMNGVPVPYFTLIGAQYATYKTEKRVRDIELDGAMGQQEYTVAVPIFRNRPPVVDVDPFGCTDCDSADRLATYLKVKRYYPEFEYELTSEQRIRLARALVDFGDLTKAKTQLRLAVTSAERASPSVETAKILESAGITYLIIREESEGVRCLEKAKWYWRTGTKEGQLGHLHELLNWEAQYLSSLGRAAKVDAKLKEFSALIAGYPNGKGIISRQIEEAYVACLAILYAQGYVNLRLEVPKEHFTAVDGDTWENSIEYYRSIDTNGASESSLETNASSLYSGPDLFAE